MKAKVVVLGNNVYFISDEGHSIGGGDYYITWDIGKENYKLFRSKHGEYPKSSHAKVVASNDSGIKCPRVPSYYSAEFVTRTPVKEVLLDSRPSRMIGEDGIEILQLRGDNQVNILSGYSLEVTESPTTDISLNTAQIEVKLTPEDILNAKFFKTLIRIEGKLNKVEHDRDNSDEDVTYRASDVFNMLAGIKHTLLAEIKNLSESIKV